ncbi:hypothetical protein VL13_08570 [Burkholderia lata]|nr:hypothetical protein VL13_08570 [Burkholderia lata]
MLRTISVILYHMQQCRSELFSRQIPAFGGICAVIPPNEVVAVLRINAQLFEYVRQCRNVVAVKANDRFTIAGAQMIEQAPDHCIGVFDVPQVSRQVAPGRVFAESMP